MAGCKCLCASCNNCRPAVCVLQMYFMVGFRADAASFFFYFLMNIASLMMFTSFGFFLVCATPMVELAQLFSRYVGC